jgi:hypothetical protein
LVFSDVPSVVTAAMIAQHNRELLLQTHRAIFARQTRAGIVDAGKRAGTGP